MAGAPRLIPTTMSPRSALEDAEADHSAGWKLSISIFLAEGRSTLAVIAGDQHDQPVNQLIHPRRIEAADERLDGSGRENGPQMGDQDRLDGSSNSVALAMEIREQVTDAACRQDLHHLGFRRTLIRSS